VDGPSLASSVSAIGDAQSALRTAHLQFHLRTVDVLTSAQRQRYAQLRGYAGSGGTQHHAPMHR
jgi:hypothetical protein